MSNYNYVYTSASTNTIHNFDRVLNFHTDMTVYGCVSFTESLSSF